MANLANHLFRQAGEKGAKVAKEDVPVLVAYLGQNHGPVPAGAGRAILLNTCTMCHDAATDRRSDRTGMHANSNAVNCLSCHAVHSSEPRLLARAILGLYNSIFHWYRPRAGLALQEVAQREPGWAGADDAHLRARGAHTFPCSSRTRWATAKALFAAGTPQ